VIRRLASAAAAAAALAGAGAAIFPQHVASVAVLAAATVAVVAAAFLLVLAGPVVSARPEPWPRSSAPAHIAPPLDPHGLRDARRDLAARRDGMLPPAVRRRLQAAADRRLAHLGTTLDDGRVSGLLSAATVEQLTTGPGAPTGPGDATAVAAIAHRLLDDLDRLLPGGPR
jgi:hypothetical protein